jgi:hypothetical protein
MSDGVWFSCIHFFYGGDALMIEGSASWIGASGNVFSIFVGFVAAGTSVLDGFVP